MNGKRHCVFVTGGTGYLGQPLVAGLLERGHEVRALVRAGSEGKLPPNCTRVAGNALDVSSYAGQIRPADTFVQLVGVSHPNPSKAAEFRSVDLASASGAVQAAVVDEVQHFVYVSVAQPAPVMKAYIAVRAECEAMIRQSGMNATILRPWYVLGPGHRWPYALLPLYWLMERLPMTRNGARRLGLVTREQMTRALMAAVENPEPRPADRRGPRNPRQWRVAEEIVRLYLFQSYAVHFFHTKVTARITKAHARGTSVRC